MAEAKIHDIAIPEDVCDSMGVRIGETIDFVVETEKAVLYPKIGDVVSVRRLHGIVKHDDTINEGHRKGAPLGAEHEEK